MPGVIKVGLTGPDIGARTVLRIELVAPAAAFAVDEMAVAEFPKKSVPAFVLRIACAFKQRTGGGAGFAMGPVQTMANHGAIVPVEGVNNPRRPVDIPAVTAVVVEEFLRVGGEPARREHPGLNPRSFKMQHQPGPFETVARRGAVGAKTIGRVVVVVLCLLYTSPSPRDGLLSRMPSSA